MTGSSVPGVSFCRCSVSVSQPKKEEEEAVTLAAADHLKTVRFLPNHQL